MASLSISTDVSIFGSSRSIGGREKSSHLLSDAVGSGSAFLSGAGGVNTICGSVLVFPSGSCFCVTVGAFAARGDACGASGFFLSRVFLAAVRFSAPIGVKTFFNTLEQRERIICTTRAILVSVVITTERNMTIIAIMYVPRVPRMFWANSREIASPSHPPAGE